MRSTCKKLVSSSMVLKNYVKVTYKVLKCLFSLKERLVSKLIKIKLQKRPHAIVSPRAKMTLVQKSHREKLSTRAKNSSGKSDPSCKSDTHP